MIEKNHRILITGATGFVGSYVVRFLLKNGYYNLICLKRTNSRIDLLSDIHDKLEFIDGDVLDIVFLEDLLLNVDAVIHTAAMVSFRKKDKKKMLKTNIEGTSNLVNLCLDHKIKKFIHISSIAALGRSENGKTINEKNEWENSKFNSDYAISKYLSELEVWRGFAEGLNIAIINPSMIMGAGYWNIGTSEFFKQVESVLRFYTSGSNGFVDVRDVARMSVQLLENDVSGERFICSAENVKYKHFFENIANELGKSGPKYAFPTYLTNITGIILDIINILSGGRSNLSLQSLKNANFTSLYDNEKSLKILNFNYIPISETLKETSLLFLKSKKENKDFNFFKTL
jgi:dihydroflavonol-4-reductase